MKWVMTQMGPVLSPTLTAPATDGEFRLYFRDLNSSFDSNGDGNFTNDPDIYIDKNASSGGNSGTSSFYRMITLNYGGIASDVATEMIVTSIVVWRNAGSASQVMLQTKLTNYQKVKVT